MRTFFTFFVDNWKFSFIMTAALILMGIFGLFALQKEAFPPVNFAQVAVTTIYPGASPEEIHDKITYPIEEEIRGISGIKDVKSVSQNDRSEVRIRIDIDRGDTDKIVSEIQRAVQRASSKLPADLDEDPIVTEFKAEEIPILELAVIGENENRLRDIAAAELERELEDVPGVAGVRLTGYREKELQILLNSNSLRANSISVNEIVASLSLRLKNIPAGYLGDQKEIHLVRVLGQESEISAIENIVIRSNDSGGGIRIKDLATVKVGSEKPQILARLDGKPATLLIVTKRAEADAIDTVIAMNKSLETFKQKLPPPVIPANL